ncbi:FAD/NAD(P)-binding domain-containing protein [Neolentinus lepideus HHB14362 ss-1]|uniref:FAD/NAD(P)-binding domain-containing protein n=1 Tax=Neolentinus lepideus HHB14362 ss-1 TaxID=1314782 RepID=A0A165VQ48_9AGAM|nr:FAD/NAD(P)-binding domain-containing protein [Neolentinus lepideus HHB14362 ss-1]
MSPDRNARLPLKFIIVGGSIAGLSCAFTLLSAGHRVHILERSAVKHQFTGSIRVPPNLMRILDSWGIGNKLSQSPKNVFHHHRIAHSGEHVGEVALPQRIIEDLGAESIFASYGELYDLLFDLAVDAGVEFSWNSEVVDLEVATNTVVLSTGSRVSGDIIIGSDGTGSVIRPQVVDNYEEGRYRKSVLCFNIPYHMLESDEELSSFVSVAQWVMWMGDDCTLLCNPNKKGYGVTGMWHSGLDVFDEHWSKTYSFEDLDFPGHKFEPVVQRLLKFARRLDVRCTRMVIHEPFENLVHDDQHIILVGDAANHLTYHGTQSVAMAVEDAVTLGGLFRRLHKKSQIPMILNAYEDIRLKRAEQIYRAEIGVLEFVSMPNGPAQQERDEVMRAALQRGFSDWDNEDEELDEYLRQTWEQWIHIFDYDAKETAEDWWIQWGDLMHTASDESDTGGKSPEAAASSVSK